MSRRLKHLIEQMHSQDNNIALRAVDALQKQGWLYDGSLEDANLSGLISLVPIYILPG